MSHAETAQLTLPPALTEGGHKDADRSSQTHGYYRRFGKRGLDVLLSLCMLPALIVVIAVLYLLARLDGGPGFYGHRRIGRDGQMFTCWKIRSMGIDADSQLQHHLATCPKAAQEWQSHRKLGQDPRIHRLGRFLRQTGLDELPQIWNVLRGEMSLVGPRPIVAEELAHYGAQADAYLQQTPGITGLWQIHGRRDPDYRQRVALDVAYLHRCSLRTDLSLIARTGLTVFQRTGR